MLAFNSIHTMMSIDTSSCQSHHQVGEWQGRVWIRRAHSRAGNPVRSCQEVLDSQNHWFSYSLVHWYVGSLIHWLTESLIIASLFNCFIDHRFIGSLIHWFTVSVFQPPFDHSLAHSLMHRTASTLHCIFISNTFLPAIDFFSPTFSSKLRPRPAGDLVSYAHLGCTLVLHKPKT